MTDLEDSSIVDLYLSRDEDAIFQTSKKYGSRLRALSLGIVADHFTAEECENDTYMEAWRSIPPHEPKSYFYQFLARITRHKSLNCCRERNRLRPWKQLCGSQPTLPRPLGMLRPVPSPRPAGSPDGPQTRR